MAGMKHETKFNKVKQFRQAFNKGEHNFCDKVKVYHQLDLITEENKEVEDSILTKNPREEEILKELCDLIYVCCDFAAAFGWDLDTAFNRVHNSNMSKLGSSGKPTYRKDGKVLKGPNYKQPWLGDLV